MRRPIQPFRIRAFAFILLLVLLFHPSSPSPPQLIDSQVIRSYFQTQPGTREIQYWAGKFEESGQGLKRKGGEGGGSADGVRGGGNDDGGRAAGRGDVSLFWGKAMGNGESGESANTNNRPVWSANTDNQPVWSANTDNQPVWSDTTDNQPDGASATNVQRDGSYFSKLIGTGKSGGSSNTDNQPSGSFFGSLMGIADKQGFGRSRSSLPPRKSYITFELYSGRFGNQVWQMDWAYRIAKVLNRTLIIPKWGYVEAYIGLPNMDRLNHLSLWEMEYLNKTLNPEKGGVEVLYEMDASDRGLFKQWKEIPSECVWRDAYYGVVAWAINASRHGCDEQIHFRSDQGLISPHRTDTRMFGADSTLLFKSLRPKNWMERDIKGIFDKTSHSQLGVHVRSWERERRRKVPDDLNKRICVPHTANVWGRIKRHTEIIRSCGCQIESAKYPGQPWTSPMIDRKWETNHLSLTCTMNSPESVALVTGRSLEVLKKNKFILAIDHENVTLDDYFQELGGIFVDFKPVLRKFYENLGQDPDFNDPEPNAMAYPFDQALQREEDVRVEMVRMKLFNQQLIPLLVDMITLSQVDVFVGLPSSSLSRHICMWRRSIYKKMNDYCVLMDLLTISVDCHDYENKYCRGGKVII